MLLSNVSGDQTIPDYDKYPYFIIDRIGPFADNYTNFPFTAILKPPISPNTSRVNTVGWTDIFKSSSGYVADWRIIIYNTGEIKFGYLCRARIGSYWGGVYGEVPTYNLYGTDVSLI